MMRANWLLNKSQEPKILRMVKNFVVFDVETTGLNPESDELIEIAALKVTDGEISSRFNSLICPKCVIPPYIEKLTGINSAMVIGAPDIATTLPAFRDFLGQEILIGHNVTFDIRFINMAAKRLGLAKLDNTFIDTLQLARLLVPNLSHYRLSDLVAHFALENQASHRAWGDTAATLALFNTLALYQEKNNLLLSRKGAFKAPGAIAAWPRAQQESQELVTLNWFT